MNHGFVIGNDENVAYDEISTPQKEENKSTPQKEENKSTPQKEDNKSTPHLLENSKLESCAIDKKEEQNKLTPVTYDSIDNSGAAIIEK